ncbi:alpha-1,3-glucanase/mutanase [Aspergillus indologenus CBS 114.80]|uniref:Alpha-1,3-glucanase/mutanase n=1 Tax=Aspergillus indologenus CBS 114.80 TaxID=1450541 RepID=A0A2V5IF16_9EURO|nr:alpha-1,3-glucanase/mutanase [Aspergillus indologenus CBS 114.80]
MRSLVQAWLWLLVGACLFWNQVQARAVFAHFMVSNTAGYTSEDWENEIQLSVDAHIDAFALNMAAGESTTARSLPNAFAAAQKLKFHLFFSFDYAGNGPWDKDDVLSLLGQYVSNDAYYFHGSNPLVSTFEGPYNAEDWVDIKSQQFCFFVPDWSSVGAKAAMALAGGVADGLFSWAAWPNGPNDMNTYVDASYIQYLDKKPYMMPISPWFFTNMPGYDKNWLWRGDDLWYTRWEQALYLAPEFIVIISWNDFGESHYIGPIVDSHNSLADSMYTAFETGDAPYNYVEGFDHSGWRQFLPYVIDLYKYNETNIDKEGLVTWYRLNAAGACPDGGTTGNTVSQLQLEHWPKDIVQDKIFFSALLGQAGDISVTIGGVNVGATWTNTPSGGVGIYHGSVSFEGHSGSVVISVTGSTGTITVGGQDISSGCWEGDQVENWNAWVGYSMGGAVDADSPKLNKEVCIEGWGMGDFNGLCSYSCSLGYCPVGACVCTKLGPQPDFPTPTGIQGYPAAGKDANYAGLCSFTCNYGYCPSTACGTVAVPLTIPTISPFTPDTCVAGTGKGELAGPLNQPPAQNTSIIGWAPDEADNGLCEFACTRDYCPEPVCLDMASDDESCDSNDDYCEVTSPCDFSLSYGSLSALQSAMDSLDAYCIDFYVLGALYGELEATVANFTSIANTSNYDEYFKDYESYMKSQVGTQLTYFMNLSDTGAQGEGNRFFTCTLSFGGVNRTAGPCPDDLGYENRAHTVFYNLIDADGFYGNLSAEFGIEPDWVVLGGWSSTEGPYYDDKGNTACNVYDNPEAACWWHRGFPIPAQNITIKDPRELMRQALPNIPNLQTSILITELEILSGSFDGVIDDVVQTYSTAVFTLAELVDRIYSVVAIGEKIEAEKKKELILQILGGVFLIVPFLGPLSGLGDVIEVANEATDIYTMAQDPESAPVAILSMLLDFNVGAAAGAATKDGVSAIEFDSMALRRRGMKGSDIKSVGVLFEQKMDQLESIVSKCARI